MGRRGGGGENLRVTSLPPVDFAGGWQEEAVRKRPSVGSGSEELGLVPPLQSQLLRPSMQGLPGALVFARGASAPPHRLLVGLLSSTGLAGPAGCAGGDQPLILGDAPPPRRSYRAGFLLLELTVCLSSWGVGGE